MQATLETHIAYATRRSEPMRLTISPVPSRYIAYAIAEPSTSSEPVTMAPPARRSCTNTSTMPQ